MVKVTVIENGPAVIVYEEGFITVDSPVPLVKPLPKSVAICRCGKSGNGVWCDGSHVQKEEIKEVTNE